MEIAAAQAVARERQKLAGVRTNIQNAKIASLKCRRPAFSRREPPPSPLEPALRRLSLHPEDTQPSATPRSSMD